MSSNVVTAIAADNSGATPALKLKIYETVARYLLGVYFLFGAYDGFLQIFLHHFPTGESPVATFHGALQHTTYFWSFMKLCELIGAASLLSNYKPALGLAILTPISVVLCLFYVFELHWYRIFGIPATLFALIIVVLTLTLVRAYWKSYAPLLAKYS